MAEESPTAPTKPKWPQLANGTTDWDTVFDDPGNGLIHAVSQAASPEILRTVTLVVIHKLFTRDNDKHEVQALSAILDNIIEEAGGEEHLAPTIEAVARLLTQIKEDRKERAREYLRKKSLKKKGDRRTKRKKKKPTVGYVVSKALQKTYKKLVAPKVLIPAGIAGVIAVFAVLMFVIAPGTDEDGLITSGNETQVTTQTKKSNSPWVRPVIIRPSQWPIIKAPDGSDPVQFATLIYVSGAKAVSTICGAYPRVEESMLVAFSSAKLGYRQPTVAELKRIAAVAKKLINKSLGKAVDSMVIVPYGDKRFLATSIPPCRHSR